MSLSLSVLCLTWDKQVVGLKLQINKTKHLSQANHKVHKSLNIFGNSVCSGKDCVCFFIEIDMLLAFHTFCIQIEFFGEFVVFSVCEYLPSPLPSLSPAICKGSSMEGGRGGGGGYHSLWWVFVCWEIQPVLNVHRKIFHHLIYSLSFINPLALFWCPRFLMEVVNISPHGNLCDPLFLVSPPTQCRGGLVRFANPLATCYFWLGVGDPLFLVSPPQCRGGRGRRLRAVPEERGGLGSVGERLAGGEELLGRRFWPSVTRAGGWGGTFQNCVTRAGKRGWTFTKISGLRFWKAGERGGTFQNWG